MFTKCPDCDIAFRVTARVLQQANGNVRCGGCGHAFSALEYLSEEMPDLNAPNSVETPKHDDLAETSRRLLQTLSELAGPEEVRIEDTGVEWRVLDENKVVVDKDNIDVEDSTEDEIDEPRYDDNSPLPDDGGNDDSADDSEYASVQTSRESEFAIDQGEDNFQSDVALSEPEEWTDLLEEVRDPNADILEVERDLAAIEERLANSGQHSPNREIADLDTQFGTQAEAMGLDIAGSEATEEVDEADDGAAETEADSQLLSSAPYTESSADDEVVDTEIDSHDDDYADDYEDVYEDELDAADTSLEDDSESDVDPHDEIVDYDESTGDFETQIDIASSAFDDDESEETTGEDSSAEPMELLDSDVDSIADAEFYEEIDRVSTDEISPESESELADEEVHIVPPPSEEEMSVNMEIDQELMAAATQDDEFSATLVGIEASDFAFDEDDQDVETIIMEGETVRTLIEEEELAVKRAAKDQFDEPVSLADTYAATRNKIRGGRRKYDPPAFAIIVSVAVLAVALGAQYIHNARESLATSEFFGKTISPIYRMLGNPITPAWDVKGWQFEATNGNINEKEAALVIVSRLSNRGAKPLPYPLVHVSLTDRWEDVMGSRILDPDEYLAGALDPSVAVQPGDKFTAVINIDNPAAEATGFKLNVCYREGPDTVRCAIEDFKN